MKPNKQILDDFGEILIREIYDFDSKLLKEMILHIHKNNQILEKVDFICNEIHESILFNFLKIFEENEEYKLIYETSGKQVNLEEISEMLKAEIHGEDGWIGRYSSFKNNASNS